MVMEKFVKNIPTMIYGILVILFLTNSIILGFHGLIIVLTAILTSNFDIQIGLFLVEIVLLFGFFVALFFFKSINKFRIFLLIILLILQLVCFKCSFYIPMVNNAIEINACVDIGGIWDNTTNNCMRN